MQLKTLMFPALAAMLIGCITAQDPDGLLFHCTFDSEIAILSPAVGPAGKIVNKPTFVPGKSGQAIKTAPAELAAIFNLPAGTFGASGCIEFWARIPDYESKHLVSEGSPCLALLRTEQPNSENAETYVTWNGNDGSGGSGLCGWVAGGIIRCRSPRRVQSGSVYSPILGDNPGEWHHYALTWNTKGLDESKHQALTFVDGKVVATTDKISEHKLDLFAQHENVLRIPCVGGNSQHRGVEIDELKIWSVPKNAFDSMQK